MSPWIFEYGSDSGLVDVGLSSRNVLGTPLVSASVVADRADGANTPIAGTYRFTMESDTTLSVEHVSAYDVKNMALFDGTRTVVADGSTENLNILYGVAIVLSASAVSGDQFEVGVGCYWDAATAAWSRGLPMELAFSGAVGDARTLYAVNDSESIQCDCELYATNAMWIENGVSGSRPFFAFRQIGTLNPTSQSDLLGSAVTFDNFAAGTPNTVDILIGGSPIDVYDVTNDTPISGGTGLSCDGTTVYRFDDATDYCSGEFILSDELTEPDTATLFVSDGGEFVELSDTSSAFVAGTSGIYLTESGAPEGVVTEDANVAFQVRLNAPSEKDATLNQRLFSLRIASYGI